MPAIWEKAVKKIKASSPGVNPYAVATASLQTAGDLKPGTRTATAKGIRRGKHSEEWRESHPPTRKRGGKIEGGAKRPHLGRAK
jgi:hypothetical protein